MKEAIKDFQALCESMGKVKKTGVNPHFKNKYIELPALLEVVKEKTKEHNFLLLQFPKFEIKPLLITQFIHSSGEVIEGSIELVHKPEDPQKLGGSITYMRRYMLTCMLGIEEEDDDGNNASGIATNTQKPW